MNMLISLIDNWINYSVLKPCSAWFIYDACIQQKDQNMCLELQFEGLLPWKVHYTNYQGNDFEHVSTLTRADQPEMLSLSTLCIFEFDMTN